jgi:hypothetical protein
MLKIKAPQAISSSDSGLLKTEKWNNPIEC